MLPKNPPQNNPAAGKKFSPPQRFGINQPEGKPTTKSGGGPMGGIKLPGVLSQPIAPLNKSSALQPLSIKPAQQIKEGKENETLMVEKLLRELASYNYLYDKVAPATRAVWDDVKLRATTSDAVGGKDVLIADIRKLINLLESKSSAQINE